MHFERRSKNQIHLLASSANGKKKLDKKNQEKKIINYFFSEKIE
jgi:hypothetical protein